MRLDDFHKWKQIGCKDDLTTAVVPPAVSSLGMFLAESQGHSNPGKARKNKFKNAHCFAYFYMLRVQSLLSAVN